MMLMVAGCGEGTVDWSDPENLLAREKVTDRDQFVEIEYTSLLDSPCDPVYDALADVDHYEDFIPGIDSTQLIAESPTTKTIQIAQRVIGRQTNAKVEWIFDEPRRRIEFKTLQSDLSYNDGYYSLEESPDGKRCRVHSMFLVKQGKGVSLNALGQATRESFLTAARGVRKRAASTDTARQ
jgi:ribosome-associated toxin RatA of RatAB toxin-antitoxin module